LNSEEILIDFVNNIDYNPYFKTIKENVEQWASDRNLIEGSTPRRQLVKLFEEVEELKEAIYEDNLVNILDEFGDVFVVMIILAKQLSIDPTEALLGAYNKIKNRKGIMLNGIFVKEGDL